MRSATTFAGGGGGGGGEGRGETMIMPPSRRYWDTFSRDLTYLEQLDNLLE